MRTRFGTRVGGILAALALEALLIALLLTIGRAALDPEASAPAISTFDVQAAPQPASEETQQEQQAETSPEQSAIMPEPEERAPESSEQAPAPPETPPVPSPPPAVVLPSENAINDFTLSELPQSRADSSPQARAPAYGPSLPASSNDTAIVGTAPDGEPLYAASWFREPNDQEMRGYLSTAQPGSYALIACKTAPRWRVEDCVGLEEYPRGSNLQRAVLAAAWQFEVRPPRRGNSSLVGAWVRIRITYEDSR